jgi:hypothetical protein
MKNKMKLKQFKEFILEKYTSLNESTITTMDVAKVAFKKLMDVFEDAYNYDSPETSIQFPFGPDKAYLYVYMLPSHILGSGTWMKFKERELKNDFRDIHKIISDAEEEAREEGYDEDDLGDYVDQYINDALKNSQDGYELIFELKFDGDTVHMIFNTIKDKVKVGTIGENFDMKAFEKAFDKFLSKIVK